MSRLFSHHGKAYSFMNKNGLLRLSALVFTGISLLFLSACSDMDLESDATYTNKQREELYKNGSLVQEKGGFSLLGGDEKPSSSNGLGVNAYLWRATLDTISFLPIAAADPFGGLITTDWYATPRNPSERIRLNILILDDELRADGVKVTVFRQIKGEDGLWQDAATARTTANKLEETILTRARQMKIAQRAKAE